MIDEIGFFEVSAMSAILPLIVGVLSRSKLSKSTLVLIFFIAISFVTDILSFYAALSTGDNSVLVNVYCVVQTFLVGLYFINIPSVGKAVGKWHAILLSGGLIAIVYTYFLLGSVVELNIRAVSISSLFIILHCGLYLIELMRNHIEERLATNPNFFITSSLFIYHSSVITIFLTFGYFDYNVAQDLWNVKLVAYIVFNIFIVIGILVEGRQTRTIG